MPNDILHYILMKPCPAALLMALNGEDAWLILLAPRSTHLHGREIAFIAIYEPKAETRGQFQKNRCISKHLLHRQYKFTKEHPVR